MGRTAGHSRRLFSDRARGRWARPSSKREVAACKQSIEARREIHPTVAFDAAAIVHASPHLVSGKEWFSAVFQGSQERNCSAGLPWQHLREGCRPRNILRWEAG